MIKKRALEFHIAAETYRSGSASCGRLLVRRLKTSVESVSTLIYKKYKVKELALGKKGDRYEFKGQKGHTTKIKG